MPTYEACLMLRLMPKKELASTLKRVAEAIFDKNGLIRSIENLGHRPIPYKTSSHGVVYHEATYYLLKFDSNTQVIRELDEEYERDIDVIRRKFFKVKEEEEQACTLDNEIKPPAYRLDVQKMVALGKKKQNPFTYKFKYNSGLDYYPFQK